MTPACDFKLHPQLQQDSQLIGSLPLCDLRLINDSQYPWCILVPRREAVREIYELSHADQLQLMQESSYLAAQLAAIYQADKLNIAAIGNMVPQLHIHHIVRYQTDKAWPAPVWGKFPAIAYSEAALKERLAELKTHFATQFVTLS